MKLNQYLDKKKFFEFYILNINSTNSCYEDVINVFSEVIVNPFIYPDGNYTIIISTILNSDIQQMVNAIVSDFGVNIKVFKSNKISVEKINYLDIMKKVYYKFENLINKNYIAMHELLQVILEKDINQMDVLKPILLDGIKKDPKLSEIVNGMFVNDLNVCKTANYVYMHRNTINNKLVVIKEETGLDIQKFQEAVLLYALIKR